MTTEGTTSQIRAPQPGGLEDRDALIKVLIARSVLALAYLGKHMTIDKDAFDAQADSIVLQSHSEDIVRLIAYWLQSWIDAERWYGMTQRECIAIVSALLLFSYYNKENRLTIQTEHDTLSWSFTTVDSTGRPSR